MKKLVFLSLLAFLGAGLCTESKADVLIVGHRHRHHHHVVVVGASDAVWVPGHYQGRFWRRSWVPGHWENR